MTISNEQSQQSSDRIEVGDIKPEQFNALIDKLSVWLNDNVSVQILPKLKPILEFDEKKILSLLKENKLPVDCISQLEFDVPFMLYGILTGKRPMIISILTDKERTQKPKGAKSEQKIKEEITTRLSYVEEKLVTSDLRKQYTIKNRAKTNIYFGSSWEVVRNQSESDVTIPVGLTYSTFRINMLKPSLNQSEDIFFPFSLSSLLQNNSESIVVTMTLEDLNDLIKNLGNAANAIKQCVNVEGKK